MTIKQKLEKLATTNSSPCITISFNTHRIFPESALNVVILKNLCKEAENRLIQEYGKSAVSSILTQLTTLETEVDTNYLLDSIHIFLSTDTREVIKSAWPTPENAVYIDNKFNIRSLIKLQNRSEEYYIMLLAQSGVTLYTAINDSIEAEVKNDDFPFSENRHFNTIADKSGDSKQIDDFVREFLNKVDKAFVKLHHESNLSCVVICNDDHYSRLIQVADKPGIYVGHAKLDHNKTDLHQIAQQGWELIKEQQTTRRTEAISEMKEAVAHGTVLTDLQEIYQAALDGRGDLLIVHEDFSQAVHLTGDRTFDLTEDKTAADTIDDITSTIAWEILSKKGRVFFTAQEDIKELGDIVLKTRY